MKIARPTERMMRAAAIFGLPLDRHGSRPREVARVAARVERMLKPGAIALVVGPSGAGKSVLLRAISRRADALDMDGVLDEVDARTALVDVSDAPLERWLACLARAGLAEAALLTRPVGALSDGQRWRAKLALCMSVVETTDAATMIVIDEFTSVLDRVTAMGVARTLGRWARSQKRSRVVAATAHDDILEVLDPDLVVHVPLNAPPEVLTA